MLTLNDAWKKSYSAYLEEMENSSIDVLSELIEATNEINKGFEYITEYFQMMPLDEAVYSGLSPSITSDDPEDRKSGGDNRLERQDSGNKESTNTLSKSSSSDTKNSNSTTKKDKYSPEDITSYLMKSLGDKIVQSTTNTPTDGKLPEYEVKGVSTVETLSDMKFPKNVVFFIQQVIEWIKRVVVYFIEKIKNIFRALLNRPTKELNPDALKLKFSKARELETIVGVKNVAGKETPVRVSAIKASDLDRYYALKESYEEINEGVLDDVIKPRKEETIKTKPVVVSIDISKDMMNLKELIQHFYDLYDGAFGSNNENLFKTDDLELILKLFKDTVASIRTGSATVYQVGSAAVEVDTINSGRIHDNLIRTNTNINALKDAYIQTSKMIQNVTNIITHKELLMLSGYGIDTKWLSSATYAQLIEISKTLKPRIKEAERDEKMLTKMQHEYSAVADKLSKMQRAFMAFSNVSYTTVYQRRIVDLCNSARYMTQLVTLRLTGITLYLKEMKDIKDMIVAISNINNTK